MSAFLINAVCTVIVNILKVETLITDGVNNSHM